MKAIIISMYATLLLLAIPKQASSQDIIPLPKEQRSSFEGRHFMIGFMNNDNSSTQKNLLLTVSSRLAATITMKYKDVSLVQELLADSTYTFTIPADVEILEPGVVKKKSLVEIESDVPVAVYVYSSKINTTESYAAIPTSSWGKEYMAMSYQSDYSKGFDSPGGSHASEFMIMSNYRDTRITFTPSAPINGGTLPGTTSIVLQKGETFLVQAYQGDLTGTRITSDFPIGVLSGHVRTSIPDTLSIPTKSKNHLVEMLPPVSAWGKEFVTVPYDLNPEGDLIRSVATEDETVLYTESASYVPTYYHMKQNGIPYDKYIMLAPGIWKANKPICVGQYMYSQILIRKFTPGFLDPSLVIIPPIEQYVSRAMFHTLGNNLPQFLGHYLNLICDSLAVTDVTINDIPIAQFEKFKGFTKVQNSGYYYSRIPIQSKFYDIKSVSGKFTGVLFGHASRNAYAMSLGSSLLSTLERNDSQAPIITGNPDCDGNLKLTSIDADLPDQSGLDHIIVLKDSTENYTWSVTYPKIPYPSPTQGVVTAQPIDLSKDARIVIETRDRAGNGKQYHYYYTAPSTLSLKEISFKNVDEIKPTCHYDSIINPSNKQLVITSITYTGDTRIRFKEKPVVPITIPPNGKYYFNLCFTPGAGPGKITGEVAVEFACSRIHKIAVNGDLPMPSLTASGFDYGSLRVGDTVSRTVYVANTGLNTTIRIDSLICLHCTQDFSADTTGLFPISLPPGDTLFIPYRFHPTKRGVLSNRLTFANTPLGNNTKTIANTIEVRGKGIAPVITAGNIDFKLRRVGTISDSLITLHNSGDAPAIVSLKRISTGAGTNLLVDASGVFPFSLMPDSLITIPLTFIPGAPETYSDSLECSIDWRYHSPVSVSYKGTGIIPVVETDSLVFPQTTIGESRDTTANLVFSMGNEDATIDSIFYIRGDASVFTIKNNWYAGRILPPGKADPVEVSFAPTTPGTYSALFGVIHDAMPSYRRDTSFVEISGTATKVQITELPNVTITTDVSQLQRCTQSTIPIRINNTGEPILLERCTIQASAGRIEYDTSSLPVYLMGNPVTIPVSVYSAQTDPVQLMITLYCSDMKGITTIELRDTVTLSVVNNQVNITLEPAYSGTPGEFLTITEKGEVRGASDENFTFKNILAVDRTILRLTEDKGEVIFRNSTSSHVIPVGFTQLADKVIITADNPIAYDTSYQWEVKIPFEIMLGLEFETDIYSYIESDQCYEGDSAIAHFSVTGVCSPYLRRVRLTDAFTVVAAFPNPASESLILNIQMPESGDVEVIATDILGNAIILNNNVHLIKGLQIFAIDTKALPSGIYTLVCRYNNDIQHTPLVIAR